ncbi:histone deacetylase hosB [Aspergillus aculeatinus CBS 121060]|uniref:Arginase/deacetylase n=1 Tax=Aspergillus aculeatinus CBS 121060 TaxID=1448322 RepID=A0ACD1HEB1_9EURO|nr:Arginase/deacetylase [Aspergillus aculeatinus CBS 121060]RAH71971.1 Arginase/deacetylase [Aspergillus aculeatinus CBS 121060]
MDPSQRDAEPASFTATVSDNTNINTTTTTTAINTSSSTYPGSSYITTTPPTDPSIIATPHPPSPPDRVSSRLSPPDPPARSHPPPRRIPSSDSLADDRRKSTPSLKKRSSTASLHSNRGTSASPRPTTASRRSSSSPLGSSPPTAAAAASSMPAATAPERSLPTAASIAADFLQKEMNWHQSTDVQASTLVLLHDACYGHRFARPRTSRAALNSIVERPERIQATVLGIAAAYVHLARRHAGGRHAPHPELDPRQLPVPPFQIRRTARTLSLQSPAVAHVHGSQWMEELRSMCNAAESRLALNGKELVRPRSAGKDGAAAAASAANNAPALHEGDLYLCAESLAAFEGALGGVTEAVDAVLGTSPTKRAFVCIRPPGHHCSSGHPSGFCWINNVHVGIAHAAMAHGLTHAAILDFDLHHGDGSQEIAWDQNQKAGTAARNAAAHKKTMVGYFSLHDINSYPCETGDADKVRNASVCIDKAHRQSIWNVHLEPWKTNQEFWDLYTTKYSILLEKARAFLRLHTQRLTSAANGPPPKAAIFLSAGFDASEWEGAGMQRHQVNVPTEFYARFTADVVRLANEEGLGTDGRVISVLEGGYSNRALTSGVLSHLAGLSETRETDEDQQIDRLASEMTDRLGLSDTLPVDVVSPQPGYDNEWWSPGMLEELEALVYPPLAPAKPREKAAPTYFQPTQSFTAKVVNPSRDRRSIGSYYSVEPEARPPLPPVGWATSTHELFKVLIPTYRQTTSCRPEELNAEASRLRRERKAATAAARSATPSANSAPPAPPEDNRMKLRVRKPKPALPPSPQAETPKRPAARSTRRTTIDAPPERGQQTSPVVRTARRKSAVAESVGSDSSNARELSKAAAVAATGAIRASGSRSSTPQREGAYAAPPVPRVPLEFQPSPENKESKDENRNTENKSTSDDVDNLAAGVRKLHIKLNVPSPEENAARERRAAEERRRANGAKVTSKTTKPPRSPKRVGGKSSAASAVKVAGRDGVVGGEADRHLGDKPQLIGDEIKPQLTEKETKPQQQQQQQLNGQETQAPASVMFPLSVVSSPVSGTGSAQGGSWTHSDKSAVLMSPPLTPGQPQSRLYLPPASEPMGNGLPVLMSRGPIRFASAGSSGVEKEAKGGHQAEDG